LSRHPGTVRGHHTFQALARSPRRASRPPVRVHFLASDGHDEQVRVAFSISRKVGGAVVRNLWRRRLRAIVAEADPGITPGAYLIGLSPDVNALGYRELRDRVVEAMGRASRSSR
jgi:ribonuclease P protein component